MSDVDFLEMLLGGVEVKWIEVGQLISPQRGRRLVKSQLEEAGSYAVYQNSMKPLGYYHESNTQAGACFVVVAGAAGEIGFSDAAFWAADDVYFFPESKAVNSKYLYHFLLTKRHEISSQVRRASIPRLSIAVVEKLEIPIPCPDNPQKSLEIQAEIVRILDAFTSLTAELTAELTARKKQYNYYRDQLLSFEDGVPFLPLSRCCESISDGDHQAPPKTENGIPFITISDVSAANKIDFSNTKFVSDSYYDGLDLKRKARTNDILYTVVGSFGIPVHIDSDKKFVFQRHIAILRPNPAVVISKYMYYALRGSHVVKQANSVATGAAQKTITLTALNRMQIAVPSLEEQARIVAILDKFDALTASLTEGLPREIELRQKQYAYYRDLLLRFPKPEEMEA